MSSRFRTSKYRHTQASVVNKDQWYPDIRTAASAPGEAEAIAASAAHIAIGWASAGSIGILGLGDCGKRTNPNVPVIHAHSGDVYDMQFSPHDHNQLATAGEDAVLKLWTIPEEGLQEDLSNASATLSGHRKRISCLQFHPSAGGVIATGSNDETIKLWDASSEQERLSLTVGAKPNGVSFSYDGALLGSTSLGIVNVWDPRAGKAVQQGTGHDGTKASRCVWLGNANQLVSTGFSKMRARQLKIWDTRNMSIASITKTIDSSTGILSPIYDADTKLLFLAGKGDGVVRCYEMVDKKPFYYDLPNFVNDIPTKSICAVPKVALDLMDTEVARLLKLTANSIVPISYKVPRKSKTKFCDDLYPDTAAAEAAISAEQYFGGENANPVLQKLSGDGEASSSSSPLASASSSSSSSSAPSSSTSSDAAPPVVVVEPEPEPELPKLNIVRSSHYRHIGGKQAMRKDCFDNVKVNFSACDQEPIVCSKKYFAVPWQGTGGPLGVFRIDEPMRLPDNLGLIETGSPICDFAFNPFNDDQIVVGLEDGHVKGFNVPSDLYSNATYIKQNYRDVAFDLTGHVRKVTKVLFHPSASDALITSSLDNTVRAWDIGRQTSLVSMAMPDTVLSMCLNYDGSALVGAMADRKIRLFDLRSQQLIADVDGHQGAKPPRVAWLGNGTRFVSSGFTKGSNRQLLFWDSRNLSAGSLGKVDLGTGSGVYSLMFDEDTSVLFMMPKGEGTVYYYEIVDEAPYAHFLNKYVSPVPAVGMCPLHKTMLDVKEVEIMRVLKLTTTGVDPTSFSVPRTRKEFFQDDVYVPTRAPTPSMTCGEWFGGANTPPVLVDLKPEGMRLLSKAPNLKRASKYNFAEEVQKSEQDAGLSKDAIMGKFYQTLTGMVKEDDDWKADQGGGEAEGVDDDEWDD